MQPAGEEVTRVPERLLRILVCPACGGDFHEAAAGLVCDDCSHATPVIDGIPRFVAGESYAESFGLQWNRYRVQQLDSRNGTGLSATRFFTETEFRPDWLAGKTVLDAGCGAGRFAEIAASYAAHVVAVDISTAVNATRKNLDDRTNVDVVQASITELPFRRGSFDAIYCIGVIQHTPRPAATVAALPPFLKPGGRLAITAYERKWPARWNGKYLVRPLTKRLPPRVLRLAISMLMPALFLVTELLFRLPVAGRAFRFVLPVANYVGVLPLNVRQRYRWALLDTFDMLSPAYDQPVTEQEIREALRPTTDNLRRLPTPAMNLVGRRGSEVDPRVGTQSGPSVELGDPPAPSAKNQAARGRAS